MSDAQPHRPPAQSAAARLVSETFHKAAADDQAPRAIPASLMARRRARAEARLLEALEARGKKTIVAALREEIRALVAAWARDGFSEGFGAVEQFETRCFQEGELAQAIRSGDTDQVFAAEEQKHRAAIVEEFGKIEIRGLQMSERVYQNLDIVYVPLQIEDETQKREVIRAGNGIEITTMPRLTVPELLAKHERAIVVGAPGSGKTTIVAYLAGMAANDRLHLETKWATSPIPFVVPMRSFRGTRLDADAIAAASCHSSAAFVRRVLEERRGLVLIDGLDEAPDGPEAALMVLQTFVKAYPGNRVLVTTRPAGPLGSERVEVPGFVTTSLLPMVREEVYRFIDQWCTAAEVSIQKAPARAKEAATKAAEDLKSRVERSRPVERLAQTPLVCSVLCIVHRFLGQRIPERRAALYEACTNALLYEWDRAKFPDGSTVGQLDAQEKRSLLGKVARKMHEERVAEISKADLVSGFAARLPSVNRSADEAESIISEIQFRSGLLIERRPGVFAFSHLTFQEYLAAVEIVHAGDLRNLLKLNRDPWWHEVIALAAGLPGANAAGFIRALLRFDDNRNMSSTATLLAAQCVETAIDLPVSLRREVEARLEKMVPPRSDDDARRLSELGEIAGPVLLRALGTADVTGRAYTAVALGAICYEPATNALVRLLSEEPMRVDSPELFVILRLGNMRVACPFGDVSVASLAAVALLHMSIYVPPVRSLIEGALKRASRDALSYLIAFHESTRDWRGNIGEPGWQQLDALISSLPETPAPKRGVRSG